MPEVVSPVPLAARREARILVVDDDADLLQITATTLHNLGYTVFTATASKAALTILQDEAIDLLLTDVVMPEMDGLMLAAAAQQISPSLKVLYMSGFAALQGTDMSNLAVIEKPFRASTLEVAVQQALNA